MYKECSFVRLVGDIPPAEIALVGSDVEVRRRPPMLNSLSDARPAEIPNSPRHGFFDIFLAHGHIHQERQAQWSLIRYRNCKLIVSWWGVAVDIITHTRDIYVKHISKNWSGTVQSMIDLRAHKVPIGQRFVYVWYPIVRDNQKLTRVCVDRRRA